MKVIAVKETWYAGCARYPGDEFEVSDADARILCAHDLTGGQKAKPVPAETSKPVASPPRPAEKEKPESLFNKQAETTESELVSDPMTKRKYRRRDMVAED